MPTKKSIPALPVREDHDPAEWGNIPVAGLDDQQLYDPYANIRVNNRRRSGDSKWKKVIDSRKKVPKTREQLRATGRRAKKMHKDPAFRSMMDQMYRGPKFLNSVLRANRDPARNQKISKKLSQIVKIPEGTMTVSEAARLHKITNEGVRYRCQSAGAKWRQWQMKSISKRKITMDSDKRQQMDLKRLRAIAEKTGYIQTPQGKFLSVRQAWRAEHKKDPNIRGNPHVWFVRMCEQYPRIYRRIKAKKRTN